MRKLTIVFLSLAFTCSVYAQNNLSEGIRALDFEKYEFARNLFTKLTKEEPSNPENYFYLGQSYFNLLNPDSAKWAYEKGISINADFAPNYAGLGQLLLEHEKATEAKEKFNKALSFSKNRFGLYTDIKTVSIVANCMVNTETKLLNEAEDLVKKGYEYDKKNYEFLVTAGDVYLERNDGGQAATFYERAIAIDENRPKAYSRVAVIWLRVKNYEAAQSDLNRAFEKDANYAPALKYQAELYYAQRNFAKAKEFYQKYLTNSEPSTANRIRFARILFFSHEYNESLTQLNEILAKDKTNLQLYRLKAYAIGELNANKVNVEQTKDGLAAMQYFMSKTDTSKLLAFDYLYNAKLLSYLDKDSLAIVNFNKALAINPEQWNVYTDMAKLYNNRNRYADAAATYKYYITHAPKPTIVDYYLMAKAYYYAKEFANADTAFQKVIEIKPDYAESYYWRGNCLASLDPDYKTDDAKVNYEKYIEMIGTEPAKIEKAKYQIGIAYSYLGYYYLVKNNKTKFKEYYTKVLELDPNDAKAKELLKTYN